MSTSPRLRIALRLLIDGCRYARDVEAPWTDFAVSIETMRRHAVAEIDLQWLMRKGYALAFCDGETVKFDGPLDFRPRTGFIVSQNGVRYAQQVLDEAFDSPCERAGAGDSAPNMREARVSTKVAVPPSGASVTPAWDDSRRELTLGGDVVKRFRVPAPNQEIVLQSFQEDGWPTRLDDPIPPARDIDPKRRLHDTILALNRCQSRRRIRFRGDGKGIGILWEVEA